MATYPATLPAPLLAGYGIQPFDPVLRSNMEAGNDRTRRVSFAKHDTIAVSFSFSGAQLAIFRDWFNDIEGADGGNGWFTIDLKTGYQESAQTVEARFKGMYSVGEYAGKRWNVRGSLEVRYV